MDDIVKLVKEKTRLEEVVAEDGCKLPAHGRLRKVPHSGGLEVDIDRQMWHLYSEGLWGDVIAWVQYKHSMPFTIAVEYLARRAGLPAPEWSKKDHEIRIAARKKEDALTVASQVFSRWFWRSTEAKEYAAGRGWTLNLDSDGPESDAGTCAKAMIGYTGTGSKEEREEMREALMANGVDLRSPTAIAILGFQGDVLSWAKSQNMDAHDLSSNWVDNQRIGGFLGRKKFLIYPHIMFSRVEYLSGRSIENIEKEYAHYNPPAALMGEKRLYFNHCYKSTADYVVIVEGQADAISLAHWGIAGIALNGATMSDQFEKDLGNCHKAIYYCMDSDVEGVLAAWKFSDKNGPLTRIICARDIAGFVFPITTDMDEKKRRNAEDANRVVMAMNKVFEFPLPQSDTTYPEADRKVKDMNDLLRAMKLQQVPHENQVSYLRQLVKSGPIFAEVVAAWAASREGYERDEAYEKAMSLITQMGEMELTHSRTKLSKLLNLSLREFDRLLKTYSKEAEKEKSEGEPEFTFGGFIGGYLVEYLYDSHSHRSYLAWRTPEGVVDSGPSIVIDGKRYLPEDPTESMKNGSVLFPSHLGEKKSVRDLITYIELYLKAIGLFPSDMTRKLIALWILNTWVYDCFDAVSYLTFMGDTGAGKSELMFRVGMIAYRPMSLSGASSVSSFFRMVNKYKGTVLIDEGDLQRSDTTQDIVKFYNQGAMKGRPITKMTDVVLPDGRHDYQEVAFQTFCPKSNTLKKAFYDDAVTSRSIVIKLQARETIELVKSNIPLNINEELRNRAQTMRNLLLRFRMEMWKEEIPVNTDLYDFSVSARLNQIAGGLLMMADGDQELQEMIRENLRDYYRESQISKSMSMDARVIEAMWTIYKYMYDDCVVMIEGKEGIKTGLIAKITNKIVERMNSTGEEDDEDDDGDDTSSGSSSNFPKKNKNKNALTAHSVGTKNRTSLQLETSKRTRDGFFILWDQLRMEGLALRYGVDVEQLEPLERSDILREMDPLLEPEKSKKKLQEKLV